MVKKFLFKEIQNENALDDFWLVHVVVLPLVRRRFICDITFRCNGFRRTCPRLCRVRSARQITSVVVKTTSFVGGRFYLSVENNSAKRIEYSQPV